MKGIISITDHFVLHKWIKYIYYWCSWSLIIDGEHTPDAYVMCICLPFYIFFERGITFHIQRLCCYFILPSSNNSALVTGKYFELIYTSPRSNYELCWESRRDRRLAISALTVIDVSAENNYVNYDLSKQDITI